MAAARRLLSLLLPLAWARPAGCTDPPGGGWLAGTVPEEERCTVERADASLTSSLFLQRFAFSRPVILRGVTDNSAFRALCTREKLLAAFGARPVRLSTANTYSYRKGVRGEAAGAAGSGQAGQRGTCPPPSASRAPALPTALGSQRWFLYPPDKTPHFHPNETTLAWLHRTYPALPPAERPLECTLRPGEVLYFPDRWWHATLNLDTSVFISTFLG
ncbi:jmjC domain-containing protein 8 isoform X8 [Calonectris borealis]|uniref:jmjC domain-containing protein 8 isoform X8 n=1 Tax=Calonectris borealis TaxID=1323832 RepID=UPI003F4BF49E